jgi:hypothetical protein
MTPSCKEIGNVFPTFFKLMIRLYFHEHEADPELFEIRRTISSLQQSCASNRLFRISIVIHTRM